MTNIVNNYTQFLLGSRFRAAALAAVLMFVPFFRWVGWAILSIVTLRKGSVEGGVVFGLSTIPLLVLGAVVLNSPQLPAGASVSMVWFSIAGVIFSSAWVWILSSVLRRYATWSSVLSVGLWVGLGVIAIIQLAYPDAVAWWITIVQNNLEQMQAAIPEMKFSPELIERIAGVMTGGYLAFTLLLALFSILVARWQQARLYNPGGLQQELITIRLGKLEVGLVIVVALWVMMEDKSAIVELLPIMSVVFVLAGLSLVQALISLLKKPWIGVVIFYVVLVMLFRYMIFVLMSLALLDSVVNIRERLIKR